MLRPLLFFIYTPFCQAVSTPLWAKSACFYILNEYRCGRSGKRGVGAPFRSETTGRTRLRKAHPDPISRSGRKEKKHENRTTQSKKAARPVPRGMDQESKTPAGSRKLRFPTPEDRSAKIRIDGRPPVRSLRRGPPEGELGFSPGAGSQLFRSCRACSCALKRAR